MTERLIHFTEKLNFEFRFAKVNIHFFSLHVRLDQRSQDIGR